MVSLYQNDNLKVQSGTTAGKRKNGKQMCQCSPWYSQTDTELVLGATLRGRLVKMKFGVGFIMPLDVSHSAVPLANGKWGAICPLATGTSQSIACV